MCVNGWPLVECSSVEPADNVLPMRTLGFPEPSGFIMLEGPCLRSPASEELNGSPGLLFVGKTIWVLLVVVCCFSDTVGIILTRNGLNSASPPGLAMLTLSTSSWVLALVLADPLSDFVSPSLLEIASGGGESRSCRTEMPLGFLKIPGGAPVFMASFCLKMLSLNSSLRSIFCGPPVAARPAFPLRIFSLSSSVAT